MGAGTHKSSSSSASTVSVRPGNLLTADLNALGTELLTLKRALPKSATEIAQRVVAFSARSTSPAQIRQAFDMMARVLGRNHPVVIAASTVAARRVSELEGSPAQP